MSVKIGWGTVITSNAVQSEEWSNKDIVKKLTTYAETPAKGGRWFSPASFSSLKRRASAVDRVTFCVLDLDTGDLPEDILVRRLNGLGYWCCYYASYSHRADHPKWRVVFQVKSPWEKEHGQDALVRGLRGAAMLLGATMDPSCKDPCRAFYFPQRPPGTSPKDYPSGHMDGRPLDWMSFPELSDAVDIYATMLDADLIGVKSPNGNYELEECPHADSHSDPVGERGGCFLGWSTLSGASLPHVHCDHATCISYSTMQFLFKLVVDGKIPLEDVRQVPVATPMIMDPYNNGTNAQEAADALFDDDSVFSQGGIPRFITPGDRLSTFEKWSVHEWVNRYYRTVKPVKGLPSATVTDELFKSIFVKLGEGARDLKGLVNAPVALADGTVFNRRGYCEETSTYHTCAIDLSPMDVRKAKKLIEVEVLGEFQFFSERDKAAALSLLLSMVQSPTLKDAPAYGVTSHRPGSGKTTLVDLACAISTGERAPRVSWAEETSFGNVLFSALTSASQNLCLDNLSGRKNSDTLAGLITSRGIATRVYHKQVQGHAPLPGVLCMTGNAVEFSDDLRSRTNLIQLQPSEQDPTTHRYARPDPIAWAIENRELLLSAIMVLAVQKRGKVETPSRFPDWDRKIRALVIGLGYPDPLNLEDMDEFESADTYSAVLLSSLYELYPDTPFSAGEGVDGLKGDKGIEGELVETWTMARGLDRPLNAMQFGYWARGIAGVNLGGLFLERISGKTETMPKTFQVSKKDVPGA